VHPGSTLIRTLMGRLAVAVFTVASLHAQSPLSNKKFVQGLIAVNATNLSSVVYAGTSPAANQPSAGATTTAVEHYVISINYGFGSRQVNVTKSTEPTRIVTTASEGYLWTVINGGPVVVLPVGAADFERQVAMSPHGVFKYAQAPDAKAVVANLPGPNGRMYTTVTFTAAGSHIKATLNESGLVERAETMPGDAVLGNVVSAIDYAGYRAVDDIQFPFRITETRDGQIILDLTLTDIKPNAGFYAEVPESIK
jgi:hypothetical protein